jgi:hypothetical protein
VNERFKAGSKAVALLLIAPALAVAPTAYAALRVAEAPLHEAMELVSAPIVQRRPAPAAPQLTVANVDVLTTWSVLTPAPPPPPRAKAPPVADEEPTKTWTCEHRPLFAGRLGEEVRYERQQLVAVCNWQ